GVLAVLTAQELKEDGIGTMQPIFRFPPALNTTMIEPPYPLLAGDEVRHVGDGVALVVAETLAQARDGAELVDVEYEPLPAAVATSDADSDAMPQVCEQAPNNFCFRFRQGVEAAVEAAFARAAHVSRLRDVNTPITANPLEPRGVIG